MKPHLTKDAIFLAVFYSLLFCWQVAKDVYSDHVEMIGTIHAKEYSLRQKDAQYSNDTESIRANFGGQISDLKVQCAKDEGISETLQRQNRDQQDTINHCQEDAIRLLAPVAQKTTVVFFDENEEKSPATARFLLLTNEDVTPVKMQVGCNWAIESIMVGPVGEGMMGGGSSRLNATTQLATVDTPAWTPTVPFMATVSYPHGGEITCSFNLR